MLRQCIRVKYRYSAYRSLITQAQECSIRLKTDRIINAEYRKYFSNFSPTENNSDKSDNNKLHNSSQDESVTRREKILNAIIFAVVFYIGYRITRYTQRKHMGFHDYLDEFREFTIEDEELESQVNTVGTKLKKYDFMSESKEN